VCKVGYGVLGLRQINGTPTKRQVSKRQVSKRLVSKRLVSKRQVSKRMVSKRPVFKFDILIKQKVFVFVIFTYY
jgi:hypothetical protein